MMGRLIETMLRLDCAANVLGQRLGRGPSAQQMRDAVRELKRETSALAASAMASGVDPVHAVRLVAEWVLASGADWQAIVATINKAATLRPHSPREA